MIDISNPAHKSASCTTLKRYAYNVFIKFLSTCLVLDLPSYSSYTKFTNCVHVRIQRGHRGSGPHLKNHKNIGLLSNTDPDPLYNHKATKPAFNVGVSLAGR